jgi:hypothetical protein
LGSKVGIFLIVFWLLVASYWWPVPPAQRNHSVGMRLRMVSTLNLPRQEPDAGDPIPYTCLFKENAATASGDSNYCVLFEISQGLGLSRVCECSSNQRFQMKLSSD